MSTSSLSVILFAASFAAAMSGIDCISAFVGSVAGYILGGNYTDGVTVTSALLSVVAIRMIVSRRKSAVSEIVSVSRRQALSLRRIFSHHLP